MRTTVDLPDELMRAAERGQTIKELLAGAVAHGLGRPRHDHPGERVALPLIGARGAGTVDVSNADLKAALADEDAERWGTDR